MNSVYLRFLVLDEENQSMERLQRRHIRDESDPLSLPINVKLHTKKICSEQKFCSEQLRESSLNILQVGEMHHKVKLRFKSLQRRKKEERLLLDMPTTDPGSDLLFSTDDEYIDANGVVPGYGTMPPRVRRHLLKSELQRRYIEEVSDGLKNMPPELIITSPSNKTKQKKQSIRIVYNSQAAAEKYERSSQTTSELPFIGQPAKRTRSWHNLHTMHPPALLTPDKGNAMKNKSPQSSFCRPLSKKEILSKEDLDIKLSLKKKIWAGVQQEDISMGIDRTRPLSWVAPHALKSKKTIGDQNMGKDLNLVKLPMSFNNKKLENEAFLSACSRKLIEWQLMNTNPENTFPSRPKSKVPLKLAAPEINADRSMFIFKHLSNLETLDPQNLSCSNLHYELKPKINTIAQVLETSKILTKISKSKSRHSIPTAGHRNASKQILNKTNLRSNKFKTGGLVVTAIQTGVNAGSGGKKRKKIKPLHYKLPNVNSKHPEFIETQKPTHSSIGNNRESLLMAATTTTIARKVKNKLKKKKSSKQSDITTE